MIRSFIRKEDIFGRTLLLYFLRQDNLSRACISRIEWTAYKDGEEPISEPLNLEPEDAQRLIDALWDAGLRPSEGSGSAGAMQATQKHLEDMRRLVFKETK